MKAIDHGIFTTYTPNQRELIEKRHPFRGRSEVNWLKSDKGVDWYDITLKEEKNPTGCWWVVVNGKTGKLEAQHGVPDTLFPVDSRLIEVEEGPLPENVAWDGAKFIPLGPGLEAVVPSIQLLSELSYTSEGNGIYRAIHNGSLYAGQIQVWRTDKKLYVGRMYSHVIFEHVGVISALLQHVTEVEGEMPIPLPEFIYAVGPWMEYRVSEIIQPDFLKDVKFIEEPQDVFFGIHKDSRISKVQLWPHPETGKMCSYTIAVHPEYRRRGVMSAMYAAIEKARGKIPVSMPNHTKDGSAWRTAFDSTSIKPEVTVEPEVKTEVKPKLAKSEKLNKIIINKKETN